MKNGLKCLISFCFAVSVMLTSVFSAFAENDWKKEIDASIEATVIERENSYARYYSGIRGKANAASEIIIKPDSFSKRADNTNISVVDEFNGYKDVAVWGNSPDYAEWVFTTPSDGIYELEMLYYPLKKISRPIETAIRLDGEFPFCEAASVTLSSAYKSDSKIKQDSLGNDYNSSQSEVERWYKESLKDESGQLDEPYRFYITAGTHTLSLYSLQETFALAEIRLVPVKAIISYDEYLKEHNGAAADNYCQMYQAEEYSEKSHSSIMPQSNRNSSQNVPFSYSKLKLNIISGENWSSAGQWLEWKVSVPEDGWYSLNFRYSQSYNKNLSVHRRLYIDGEVPFSEVYCFDVPYKENWGIYEFADKNGGEMRFWFTKGEHTLRLEAVLGEIRDIISDINDVVYDLNYIYQRINMIVGASPDQYRDYKLDASIPDMLDIFKKSSAKLKELRKQLNVLSGGRGTTAGIMDVLAYQLDDMIKAPSTVPVRAATLNSNISSLSSTGEELKSQAMDIDYITVASPSAEKPKANDNFFQALAREAAVFVYSFITDYDTFAEDGSEKGITVWINSGRDQAQVINRMITDMFVPNQSIPVKLKLVDASLIQAFLSGEAPDAMLMTARGQPVNLAIRGALADLTKMPDFEKVKNEFQVDALKPYYYNDGCYGLPDQQSFFMMFYRKDILKELNLSVPQTWDEFYEVMRILQINNMDVGIPYAGIDAAGAVDGGLSTTSIFSALLLQNGGSFYNGDGTKTALTTPQAAKAFEQWTNLYTKYGAELSYDFYNRFRTGIMPLGIAAYTMYSQIYVAAPEIKNLWSMVEIPGIRREDGSIDRSQGASGTACVITSTSKNKEKAWEFIRWWTGADAQSRYADDIESVLGMAARYPTANKTALSNIKWSRTEYERIVSQWNEVKEIPEIPGSYYTVRGIDNAFRSVVINGKQPKETLVKYSRDIDAEITRKRGEFYLDKQ